ncbi:MAG: hypothetical protein IKF96_03735, partial [Eggerthellaceae bacterium]|nr:hypothetical protein [Eggerthellaceae bacterium]
MLEQNNLCICSRPEDMDHVLRWYDIFENGSTCPYDIDSHMILHVRKTDDALPLLEQNTSDFVMLVTEDTCFPASLVRYKDRILHVYSPEGFEAAQVMVERVFMELLIWENRLNYAVGSKATLEELLNAGSSMLGNFLCLITPDGNVTACSTEAAAPQGNLNMLSSCAIIPGALHALIDWTDFQKAFPRSSLIAETIEIDGITCIRIPIWMKTYAFGFAVMVCEHTPYSRGLERAFLNFSCYLKELTRKIWTRESGMQIPHLFTLNTLFGGAKLNGVSPESIFVELGISENSVYKLVAMSARDCIAIGFEKVRTALQRLHGGHCLVAPYEDLLIGLCYSEIDGSLLSHRRTEEDLARLVFEPYGITCTMSQVYPDIRDTHL